MGAYRSKNQKEADALAKKAGLNILSERFTPEQLLTIEPMLDRLDKLEDQVKSYKKGLAEAKAQVNEMYGEYCSRRFKEATRVSSKMKGRKPVRGADSRIDGDNKGEK